MRGNERQNVNRAQENWLAQVSLTLGNHCEVFVVCGLWFGSIIVINRII